MNLRNTKAGFLLSAEHEKLPLAELNALIDIFNLEGNLNCFKNYLILDSSISKDIIKKMVSRGGYTNEGHLLFSETPIINQNVDETLNNFFKTSESLDFPIEKSETFAVRVLKLEKESPFNSMEIERKLGGIIKKKTSAEVNLKNPVKTFRVVISDNTIYTGLVLEKRDIEYFQNNRPHLRAYFHPGCIMPKLARCLVNLSRVKEREIVLDPFCGTGGFLIEAGFLGCKLIGSDIDEQMVKGAILNLKTYDLSKQVISIKQNDAKNVSKYLEELGIEKIDGIVTDPPYGISTLKKGDMLEIFKKIVDVLKNNDYLVFAAPNKMELDLKLVEFYEMRVHKSLTRYIHVYKKD
ncbi:putative RNA methylase [Methanococcus maripaludis C5]|uniref:tRNA (guanine(10)-N(2))-dimethyltransferase n=1 Tax=Methanococcus maripaludis (strain C5 / ATCC BAA-1333) TaxID=402880 RepID=A4G039_METM5|nr:THUMP domain-containing protein [Methanococcus maripaludis]ABO35823.1 putative RNA methylase [Methanococcus maripaludis C5]